MNYPTLCRHIRGAVVLQALGLSALRPRIAAAQVSADSVPIWTRTVQVGPSLAARDAALSKIARLRPTSLPAETQRVLIAELNRVHQVMKTGGRVSDPGQDPEDSVTQRTERSFYLRSVAYMRELTASDDRIDEPELTTSLTCTMRLP